ncbi:MAG: zinc ribbon domain-containing protein [Umezawaea sp.]
MVERAYRYRFCPNDEQVVELSRTFGCGRLVYNRALEARTTAWRQERRRVGYGDTSALLTEWKQTDEFGFLAEVSSVPLQQCLRHQYKADWYGRTVVVVDQWDPPSKTCSRCGHLLDVLPMGVREWICPSCVGVHDRDVNAARNMLAAGRAVAR